MKPVEKVSLLVGLFVHILTPSKEQGRTMPEFSLQKEVSNIVFFRVVLLVFHMPGCVNGIRIWCMHVPVFGSKKSNCICESMHF
jgi:hypothetical protein